MLLQSGHITACDSRHDNDIHLHTDVLSSSGIREENISHPLCTAHFAPVLRWFTLLQKQCRLGLFQDSDFAGDLEDSKSTSGGTLCVFGSHTFVPKSWMCKKQTSVSHSSTESEIISFDSGLRLDGIPALDLWDLIVLVLGNIFQIHD